MLDIDLSERIKIIPEYFDEDKEDLKEVIIEIPNEEPIYLSKVLPNTISIKDVTEYDYNPIAQITVFGKIVD